MKTATDGIFYNGVRLAPGSRALDLWVDGKTKELAAHMREVDQKHQALEGTPAEVADRITAFRERTGTKPWPEAV